jgi:hypothetical protein
VLWDSAHKQGHPVQVIRSSCHVATLQYTVRLRVIRSSCHVATLQYTVRLRVIRSSCHVATLQYTVRLRPELLLYKAPPPYF